MDAGFLNYSVLSMGYDKSVELLGSGEFLESEPGQLAVPVDGNGAARLEGVDGALGEFEKAVCHS